MLVYSFRPLSRYKHAYYYKDQFPAEGREVCGEAEHHLSLSLSAAAEGSSQKTQRVGISQGHEAEGQSSLVTHCTLSWRKGMEDSWGRTAWKQAVGSIALGRSLGPLVTQFPHLE